MYFTEISADAPDEVTYCIAVPPQSEGEFVRNLPSLKALSFFHHGAYEKIPDVRKRLVSYAEEKDLKLSGTFRSLYLEGSRIVAMSFCEPRS